MFRLFINDTELYLPVDFDSEIMRESPILNARGDYSYPFTVPYLPNAKVFNHIKEIESVEPNLPLTFELQWADEPILRGTVPEFSLSGDDIEITLIGGKTRLWSAIKNYRLDQIDLGSEDLTYLLTNEAVIDYWSESIYLKYPDRPYVFAPVYAPNFFPEPAEGATTWPSLILNNWDFETEKLKPPLGISGTGEYNVYCRHLYIRYILKKIIEHAGYTIGTDDLEGLGLDGLYLASLVSIEQSFVYEFNRSVPQIDINEFLETLEKMFGIFLVPDDLTGTCAIRTLNAVLANLEIDSRHNEATVRVGQNLQFATRKGVLYKYALDGDEYENAAVNPAKISVTGYIEVDSFDDLPAPWNFYENFYYKTTDTGRFYTCEPIPDDLNGDWHWVLIGEFADLEYGSQIDPEPIELAATPFPVIVHDKPFERTVNGLNYLGTVPVEIPYTTREGNSIVELDYYRQAFKAFPMILMFNRGWKYYEVEATDTGDTGNPPATLAFTFPHSNYDSFDLDESPSEVPGPALSLKFTGTYGLNSMFLQQKLYWQMYRRAYRHRLDITAQQAFALDLLRKYFLNDVSFLIDKIYLNFGRNEVKTIRVDLFTASGGEAANLAKWILEDGTWDDQGVWMDDKTWKDS